MHFDMNVRAPHKPRVLMSAADPIVIEHLDGDDLSLEYPPGTGGFGVLKKGDVMVTRGAQPGNLFLASSAEGCRIRIHLP
jgi:hypothetical protein